MSKSAVTKLFVGSIIALAAGVLLGLAAVIAAFAGGGFVMRGPDGTARADANAARPMNLGAGA